jgi:hypothetical protein
MRKLFIIAFVVHAMFLPRPAFSADELVTIEIPGTKLKKKCLKEDLEKCALILTLDTPAPFSGVLMTVKQAADITAKAEFTDERIRAAADVEIRLAKNENETQKKLHVIDLEAKDKEIKLLEQALADSGPKFYEHPAFVIPVTVVVTLGVVALAIKGAKEL